MGLLDNFAKRVADQISKNAPIATPINPSQITQQTSGYGSSVALDRDPNLASVPFAPGRPIIPGAINPVRSDGRPDPRRYEYQVAQNINITETRLVPFKTLRAAAEQIDIIRRCIEVLKSKMIGLEWDIVLTDDTAESVASDQGVSALRAQQIAKDQFGPEISRLRHFWRVPDQSNGLIFADWLNMALEEILVLDAFAVWPQKTVGKDLHGLQILDGSTIKPLIDDRGMRPQPPFAAYQQILFGFPRSEFSAPNETVEADGEFSADELSYMIRNRRSMSVYGFSPVERSLPLADLYLRRQQWLRAEYTDGVLPALMFKSDSNFGNNPDLLRAYENVFNDDLSGQTEQRKKARLLPAGLDPIQFDGYAEKFSSVFDEYLINSICGHFGVLPTEIGFAPKGGLGGSGIQNGEADSSEVIGLIPLQRWLGRMLSHLSYVYLGMPRELEFRFMPSGRHDDLSGAQADDIRLKNGTLAINEARAKAGLPLLDAEEADSPIFASSTGSYFVTENGMMDLSTGGLVDATDQQDQPQDQITDQDPTQDPTADPKDQADQDPKESVDQDQKDQDSKDQEDQDPEDQADEEPVKTDADEEEKSLKRSDLDAIDEARAFIRWIRKSPSRPFEFKHLSVTYAETLNKFVEIKDYDGARWYAERYLQ